jgi:microcystin degradation protein MlrC
MRAFTAGLGTETNTFSPLYIGLDDFRETCLYGPGEHPRLLTEVSAPLEVLRRRRDIEGWTVVEGGWAFALPGGRVGASAYRQLREALLDQLRAALPVDFVALAMHGAMASVDCDDCEGDVLEQVRALVGPSTPVGIEIDPHANLSPAMTANADVIVAMKEYPHVDFLERAEELIGLLARTARGEVRPVSAVHDCRTIGRFHTFRQPMRGFVDALKARERDTPGLLSLSFIHGFPWADVADMGAKVLAVTDGDAGLAERIAAEVGAEAEAIRADAFTPPLPIDQALGKALAAPAGPVVVADVGDNPGGGAPGDCTLLLRALIGAGAPACLGPLWDPMAVRIASAAGEGAEIELRIGGKTGRSGGPPLDVRCRVLRVEPAAWQSWAATRMELGAACAVRIGPVEVVLASMRDQAYGPDLFTNLGVDPAACRIVAVKSAQHFVDGFQPIARDIVLAGGGGPLETDFRRIDYRNIARPKWPLDDIGPGEGHG